LKEALTFVVLFFEKDGLTMSKMSYINKTTVTALSIALCVVLPMAFHLIPNGGSILSPMHIPVLLCGLVCGWPYGLLCGIAGPVTSSLITGMPGAAYLPAMMAELAVYGLVSGKMMQIIHTGKKNADIYISMIAAMIAGRIVAGILNAVIFTGGNYSISLWISSYFVTALPGIAVHLIFVPTLIGALEKAGLIPARYAKKKS